MYVGTYMGISTHVAAYINLINTLLKHLIILSLFHLNRIIINITPLLYISLCQGPSLVV